MYFVIFILFIPVVKCFCSTFFSLIAQIRSVKNHHCALRMRTDAIMNSVLRISQLQVSNMLLALMIPLTVLANKFVFRLSVTLKI